MRLTMPAMHYPRKMGVRGQLPYAAHFIEIAECSDCDALRDCAAALKHQLDSTCNCHWAETGRLEAATQAS